MQEQPYVDAEDLQFGDNALKKEEQLDRALKSGKSVDELEDEPDNVRPGGKAEPAPTEGPTSDEAAGSGAANRGATEP